ncbi:DUF2062 domain-containing protein [Nannocystaceae bacterium ST9]
MLAGFRLRVLGLLKLNGSPHGIALGFTLGLGCSLIPIPFLGMFVALALAPVLGGNMPATYFGSAVVNPLTGPGIYFAELWVGAMLLRIDAPSWEQARGFDGAQWWSLFGELLPAFALGGVVVAAGAALLGYSLLRLAVTRVQTRAELASSNNTAENR